MKPETPDKNFAWEYVKSSGPSAKRTFSRRKVFHLLKVFDSVDDGDLLDVCRRIKGILL